MVVAEGDRVQVGRGIGRLLTSEWFEAVPSSLLLLLAVVLNVNTNQPWQSYALDVVTCLAAACSGRFPRAAGITLAASLAALLALPASWATMGVYACLIPILGAGIRGKRRAQAVMMLGYGLLLVLITIHLAPNITAAAVGSLVWFAFIAIIWLVAQAFALVARSHEMRQRSELQAERHDLARQLHDTVARTLTAMTMQVERLQQRGSATTGDLETIAVAAQDAQRQLRLAMLYLTDPSNPAARRQSDPGSSSLEVALRTGRALLEQHGFHSVIGTEGDPGRLTVAQSGAMAEVAGEVFANVIKHGDPAGPVAIALFITPGQAELSVLNQVREKTDSPSETQFGLRGVQQRLAEVGGIASTDRSDSRWQIRLLVPLGQSGRPPALRGS